MSQSRDREETSGTVTAFAFDEGEGHSEHRRRSPGAATSRLAGSEDHGNIWFF
jgi:hypothetical protein